jgi:arabinan endo-1,5-alpha-L-arabinosidase
MNNPSSTALVTSKWTHIAGILRGNNISVYLNCTLTNSETTSYLPRYVARTNNYIGRSNWASDYYANAKFRNVRIYNRALSQSELRTDFNNQ